MGKIRRDVSVRTFDSCKGKIATIRFRLDCGFREKFDSDYVRLEFNGDYLYFVPSDASHGLKLSGENKTVIQVSRTSLTDMLKCFEGEYDLKFDYKQQRMFITYADRTDIVRDTTFGKNITGNRYDMSRATAVKKDSVANITEEPNIPTTSDIVKAVYGGNDVKPVDKPFTCDYSKEYAKVVKSKGLDDKNKVVIDTLIKLAISQIDCEDSVSAKNTLLTLQGVLRI